MPEQAVNGVRLHYEEHGAGAPIALVHGCGGSALGFADAVEKLAGLGRVIAYDRRGSARSERPEPYERTSVAEHADDAAASAGRARGDPAIVIGRSYGGTVASDLALRYPDRVRALVLLEPDAPRELAPAAAEWVDALGDRLRRVSRTGRRRRRRRGSDHRGGRRERLALVSRRVAAGRHRQRARDPRGARGRVVA